MNANAKRAAKSREKKNAGEVRYASFSVLGYFGIVSMIMNVACAPMANTASTPPLSPFPR